MLPQQPDDDNEAAASAGMARNVDNVSDNGSFHASVWEEERLKRSHVRWAGDRGAEEQQQQQQTMRGSANSKEEDHQGGTAILQDQSTIYIMFHEAPLMGLAVVSVRAKIFFCDLQNRSPHSKGS